MYPLFSLLSCRSSINSHSAGSRICAERGKWTLANQQPLSRDHPFRKVLARVRGLTGRGGVYAKMPHTLSADSPILAQGSQLFPRVYQRTRKREAQPTGALALWGNHALESFLVVFVASLAFGHQILVSISVCRDMGSSVAYTQWKDPGHVAYLRNIAPTDTSTQMPTRDEILVVSMFLDRIEAISLIT